jgi:exonuclease VII small subunit
MDRYDDMSYRQEISHLENMLNHYLQTGTMLAITGHGSLQEAQQK